MAGRPPNESETTPSGFKIEYWASVGLNGAPQRRRYKVNSEAVANVTSLTGQELTWNVVRACERKALAYAEQGLDPAEESRRKMERGTRIHDELIEQFAKGGRFPDVMDRHFIAGHKWFIEAGFQLIDGERMVASVEHGYAGRFDLLGRTKDGRVGRFDLKTVDEWKFDRSGNLYPPYLEHELQLELYELAAVESGYDASDFRAVVRLGPDGHYDATESVATTEDVLSLLARRKQRADHEARRKAA